MDNELKNKEKILPPLAGDAAVQPESAAEQPLAYPKFKKKEARFLFNAFNFGGLHLVGNSALSLWITYNIAPLKATQNFLHGLASGLTPIVKGWDAIKQTMGFRGLHGLSEEVRAERINQSARSATETAVMCIAGSIILLPVKWWEDHRHGILTRIDEWWHPEHKKARLAVEAEAKERGIELEDPSKHEHKETWLNLIRARVLALVPIFWIDGSIQTFNNNRAAAGKGNVDTYLWEKGAQVYDWLAPQTRERFINFFSSKGVSKEGLQPLVRNALEKTVGQNTGRMIFAEQARMFSKEIYLTTIYTGFLFVLGKTRLLPWIMESIGVKSKKDKLELEHALDVNAGFNVVDLDLNENGNGNGHDTKDHFTSRIQPKEKKPAPEILHTAKINATSEQAALTPSMA